jgi:hypothetical protein
VGVTPACLPFFVAQAAQTLAMPIGRDAPHSCFELRVASHTRGKAA